MTRCRYGDEDCRCRRGELCPYDWPSPADAVGATWSSVDRDPAYVAWVVAHVDRLLAYRAAVEDILLTRTLAAHPWALHHLAAQPEWATYAHQINRSKESQ